ncbi:hypothetical protein TELCIR_06644 [Teladorsagia circumcincta]|uniref:RNA-directed DNA polymerase n=1 Tax=Teladorsagia circumcincta TaxID=45464 RepID=A0A2G9UPT2_TELCI|nr:hypothetical protein TELCIR_06644 [Teladorsagia circumcincta]
MPIFEPLAPRKFLSLTSQKAVWSWQKEHEEAFERVKAMIVSAPVLKQPDVASARSGSRAFLICTDASTQGLGAVLSQEGEDKQIHPIFFASKSLSKAERRYHMTDLEALAVVFAVRRFHMFIYGLPAVVMTDHQPLTALFKRSNVSARVLRWSLELQRYKLDTQYVKGKANVVADALSRGVPASSPEESLEGVNEAVVNAVSAKKDSKWLEELRKDSQLGELVRLVEEKMLDEIIRLAGERRALRVADFSIDEGDLKMFLEDGRAVFVVPKALRYEIFHEAHSGDFAGHFSAHKVLNRLRKEVYWPGMAQDVFKWCQKCFFHNSREAMIPPLKPIVTTKPYEIVGVDVLELGPTSNGNKYAVTVIDHFSKYAAAYPTGENNRKHPARVMQCDEEIGGNLGPMSDITAFFEDLRITDDSCFANDIDGEATTIGNTNEFLSDVIQIIRKQRDGGLGLKSAEEELEHTVVYNWCYVASRPKLRIPYQLCESLRRSNKRSLSSDFYSVLAENMLENEVTHDPEATIRVRGTSYTTATKAARAISTLVHGRWARTRLHEWKQREVASRVIAGNITGNSDSHHRKL